MTEPGNRPTEPREVTSRTPVAFLFARMIAAQPRSATLPQVTPQPGEPYDQFVVRAHRQLMAAVPEPMERTRRAANQLEQQTATEPSVEKAATLAGKNVARDYSDQQKQEFEALKAKTGSEGALFWLQQQEPAGPPVQEHDAGKTVPSILEKRERQSSDAGPAASLAALVACRHAAAGC